MPFQMNQRDTGVVTTLHLTGKLAGDANEALGERIDSLLKTGSKRLILNLAGITFVDSGALGGLLLHRATVMAEGGQLHLLNVTERIADLMVTTKLEMVFDTFESELEAAQSFRYGPNNPAAESSATSM